ncbi:hypothetical protein AB9M62_56270 [Bacillales bacterium AN1005]
MSLKIQAIFNICMVTISWMSLYFIGIKNIKRFLPATIIIGIIEILHAKVGKDRKWWVFYNKPNTYVVDELPFNTGPFIFITMWTLKIAYGNFKKFMLINALIHAFFAFPYTFAAKKLKYYTLVRFNNIQFFIYFLMKAPLLYLLQYLVERSNTSVHKQ